MEREPLLPYIKTATKHSPAPSSAGPHSLLPLPENDAYSPQPPLCLTPSEFKDRLIFGSPSLSSSSPFLADALALSIPSPSPNPNPNPAPSASSDSNQIQQQQSWLTDPNFPWKGTAKSCLHRSRTAPALAVINDLNHKSIPKPQFGSQSIVRQAVLLLVVYLSLGVVIYSFNRDHFSVTQTHPVVDALYFCIVTMCTIGYGDITPNTAATKLFSILFVLVGFGFIDILLSGMVGYVLDLQENYLLQSAKGRSKTEAHNPGSYIIDVKKGRMRIRMKVGLALGVVILCIGIGACVMCFLEGLGWLDSFYLSVMSVTTVGYGDRAFKSMPGRLFASVWLLVSTLAVARAFLYLAEARVDKRHRRLAKWVLGQDMTVAQFLAADMDNNGFVSKSEYVIYKLKEMGTVSEKDILQICEKFDDIDTGKCGKITLADLMESNH